MKKPFWETTYRDLDVESFGDASEEILGLISALPRSGRVLDLGCGEGRNAIPLAQAGLDVTAVDISEAGVRKLDTIAHRSGIQIHSVVTDMTVFPFEGMYDLIICHGSLHLIPREKWEPLIEKIKAHTKKNGYNAITVLTDEIAPPSDLADICVGLFRDGELFEKYTDWHMPLKKSYTFQDEHPGGHRHLHSANKLVARNRRKPRYP